MGHRKVAAQHRQRPYQPRTLTRSHTARKPEVAAAICVALHFYNSACATQPELVQHKRREN